MSHSLYQTTLIRKSNSYRFTTDSGLTYTVYFDNKSDIFVEEELDRHAIYIGFSCEPKQEKFERDHDSKVGRTIMHLIANAFKHKKWSILVYVCSQAQGQARHRSITFGKWYQESRLVEKINLLRKEIDGEYYGILFSKKHPLADEIELVFDAFTPEDKFGDQDEDDNGLSLASDAEEELPPDIDLIA